MVEQRRNRRVPAAGDRERRRHEAVRKLLTDSRRRYVLYRLHNDGACQLTELATEIAAKESDSTCEAVPLDRIRAVYLDLHRSHIPKLTEVGLVHYAEDVGEVMLVETSEEFTDYLTAAATQEDA